MRAWQAGADFVKVFPTSTLGAKYIKDLRGPLPQSKLVATGGVHLDTIGDFLRAGATALGVGSALITKKVVAERDFARLEADAAAFLQRVRDARGTN